MTKEAVGAEVEGRKTWAPPEAKVLGADRPFTVCLGIVGKGGVGKTTLLRFLLLDKDYGIENVHTIFAEDGSTKVNVEGMIATYVRSFLEAEEVVDRYIEAYHAGKRVPKVLFVDSVSGIDDYQMKGYRADPMESKAGNRDKVAEYGDKGELARDFMLKCRNEAPFDVIVTMTSHEGLFAREPELAVSGKVIPKNFVRWTDVCLHMVSKAFEFGPDEVRDGKEGVEVKAGGGWHGLAGLHRSWHRTEDGGVQGVSRNFLTIDSGEACTKGHLNLDFVEPAVLADVLRKIHSRGK